MKSGRTLNIFTGDNVGTVVRNIQQIRLDHVSFCQLDIGGRGENLAGLGLLTMMVNGREEIS